MKGLQCLLVVVTFDCPDNFGKILLIDVPIRHRPVELIHKRYRNGIASLE